MVITLKREGSDVLVPTKKGITVHKVSDTMKREEMERFEEGFPDGVYAIPREEGQPKVALRALFNYCEKHGKHPNDLSDEERKQFLRWD